MIEKKLEHLLSNLTDYEIIAIDDWKGIIEQYCRTRRIPYQTSACRNRIEAQKIISTASRLVMFWNGRDTNDLVFYATKLRVAYKIVPVLVTAVVNKDHNEDYDVYIGRGGMWGNPFKILPGTSETRDVVIAKYREYFEKEILSNPERHKELLRLKGMTLGCHCKPHACHGDIIAEYLNSLPESEE